jgi:hypothetical protein
MQDVLKPEADYASECNLRHLTSRAHEIMTEFLRNWLLRQQEDSVCSDRDAVR